MKFLLLAGSFLLVSNCIAFETVITCPAGYSLYEDHCYKYYNAVLTQSDAFVECINENAYLVEITSNEENTFVSSLAGSDTAIWLGMEDPFSNGIYEWYSGLPIGAYNPWVIPPGEMHQCVVRIAHPTGAEDNLWNPNPCVNEAARVCEAVSTAYYCKQDWVWNAERDVCLRAIKGVRRPYSKASAHCKRLGGDLANKITTPTEIKQAMRFKKFRGHMWIGVARNNAGVWTYADGTPTSGKLPWRRTPNADQKCATLKRGKWVGKRCNKRFVFVCQRDPWIHSQA